MIRPAVIALAALAGGLAITALGARGPRVRSADRSPLWRTALAQLRRVAPWLVEVFAKRDVRAAVDRAGLAAVVSEREIAAAERQIEEWMKESATPAASETTTICGGVRWANVGTSTSSTAVRTRVKTPVGAWSQR